jgi:RNA polymerase sigma factor (sigma-70 family)
MTGDIRGAIDAVWRIEAPKVIARLARLVRDVGLAEDLAHDALVTALETWPTAGIPSNPGAWLTATARNRAIDQVRHRRMAEVKHGDLGYARDAREREDPSDALDAALDDDVGDDLLRVIFTACHPVLATEARIALTLRLLGGLTTEEIARAFLAAEPTIAQRIVRAKRTLAEAHVPFELPRGDERVARLGSVLEVIYLIFNEGYAATAGADWMRPALADEALRLGRVLGGLMPDESEVHGLVALMEIQTSRAHARVGADGAIIRLLDQDRSRWDRQFIRRGLEALARAESIASIAAPEARGPYALQAAIAACHARARTADDTDWPQIAALYARLALVAPSPVVEVNRAVAIGLAFGPQQGLDHLNAVAGAPALQRYHLLFSVRGDLLERLGRLDEARAEFERAAALTRNDRERDLLRSRAGLSVARSTASRT